MISRLNLQCKPAQNFLEKFIHMKLFLEQLFLEKCLSVNDPLNIVNFPRRCDAILVICMAVS